MALLQPAPGTGGQPAWGITVMLPDVPLFVPDQAQQIMGQLVEQVVNLALQEVAGRVSDEAPRSEGILAQSFGANPATTTGGIEIVNRSVREISGRVFSALPYAIVMDQGRTPGKPISRVGIDSIGLWAQRKLGLSADQAARAKWAIATSIIRRGIAPTHFFEKGVKSSEPRVQQMFDILGQQIATALTGTH